MNKPEVYYKCNGPHRRDLRMILDKYYDLFQWRSDGMDTMLDIGCGTGDITHDYLIPILPKQFKSLVGADISKEMVKFANDNHDHKNLSFRVMDIGSDNINKFLTYENEQFDHITSFYCLNWVPNQKNALKNIYDLLKPNGDCLLVSLAENTIFDAYYQLLELNKWSKYMWDVDDMVSPYYNKKNAVDMFGNALQKAGFQDFQIELLDKKFEYDGLANIKKIITSVNPFIDRIPKHEQSEFINDQINVQFPLGNHHRDENGKYALVYSLLVTYIRKS